MLQQILWPARVRASGKPLSRYRVESNNCEHFCHWCLSGENRSVQVDRLLGWVSTVSAAWGRFAGSAFGTSVRPRAHSARC